ncbi:MAG: IS3 family transposase, partial [Syntrophobacteraceae bacterium]
MKKSGRYLQQSPSVRYRFIEDHRGQHPVLSMLRVLGVSTSGYYAWKRNPGSTRKNENLRLVTHIKAVHEESGKTYGSPRIHAELCSRGIRCGKNRVARLMKQKGIQSRHKRKFKATTDSNHQLPVYENRLNRSFDVSAPNTSWVADITYIWTREGWLYLAVLLDLFSRRIIGWSMSERMEKQLVIDALLMALGQRRPAVGMLHHSDRGSQYASKEYQALLRDAGISCSMSRKANCWDNAVSESFFSTLKREWV